MGAELLIKTIEAVKLDNITPQKQDDSQHTYAPMLTKDMCPIDFSKPAQEVHNKIRGLSKFPCAKLYIMRKSLKFTSRFYQNIYTIIITWNCCK
jgi:methionyl-tRNA formyltransferase